jgi:hypothetical protein
MHNAIVILQNDPARAEDLVSKVRSVSDAVFIVRSLPELQKLASQFPIQIGVLDLGLVTFQEISRLRRQLGIEIVCTHHTPDDGMWTKALERERSIVVLTTMGQPSAVQFSKSQRCGTALLRNIEGNALGFGRIAFGKLRRQLADEKFLKQIGDRSPAYADCSIFEG